MGQTYCNNCCINEKPPNFDNDMQNYVKQNDHTPLQSFAIKVKQVIQLNSMVKEIYTKCRNSHIPERAGTKSDIYYLFNYAAYYDGQWKNGLPHGQGKLIYDDGSMYEGCFKQGYAQCQQAIYIYNTGSSYRGQVRCNKARGQGQLSTHKFYYKGKWLNDLPHGTGRQVYGQNTYYDGQFVQGRKQGMGIYYWNSKQYFSGHFLNNVMEGEGQLALKDYTYKGSFKKGLKQGQGKIINNKNNWKYQGHFANNQMNGMGKYQFNDGTKFQGKFLNDERTSQGIIILPNGKVIQCQNAQHK